jgi:uncharacterized protein YjiS (DUF1127 family)
MTAIIRSWCQARRYQAMISSLEALSASELSALWITPTDIPDLARKVAAI